MVWNHMITSDVARDIYSFNAHLASRGAQHDASGVMAVLDAMLAAGTGDAQSSAATPCADDAPLGSSPEASIKASTPSHPLDAPSSAAHGLANAPSPDAYSFSVVFKSAAGAPALYPPDWLLTTYHAMAAVGVAPNTKVVTALLTAAVAAPGAAEGVLELVPQWRGAGLCDDALYAQLLLLCGRRGLADRLADVWIAFLEVCSSGASTRHARNVTGRHPGDATRVQRPLCRLRIGQGSS